MNQPAPLAVAIPSTPTRRGVFPIRPILVTAFWSSFAILVIAGVTLAATSSYVGSPDSISNLETARNIAEGRGFTSRIVQQLAAPQVVPGPEVLRPPALPYLLAALSPLGGVGPTGAVVLNIFAILATAVLIRAALRALAEPTLADLAGIFVILAHSGYTALDALNNNLLTALTAAMLLVAALARRRRLASLRVAILTGVVTAAGFLTKQTFMLGAIPLSLALLASDRARPTRARALDCSVFLATFGALSAPYLLRNILLFGNPLYAPANALRLPVRYELPGYEWHNRVLLFGRSGFTYADILKHLGLARMLRREFYLDAVTIANIVRVSPLLIAVTAAVVLLTLRRHWVEYAGIMLLMIMPVFDGMYWVPEPRYMWPVIPCLFAMIGVGIGSLRSAPGSPSTLPQLKRGVESAVSVALAVAIVIAAASGVHRWKQDFSASHQTAPEWTSLVQSLPKSARIISASPYTPAWFGDRTAIVAPLGGRSALATVAAQYHPDYYIELTTLPPAEAVAFQPEELQLMGEGTGWRLYRILHEP